MTRRRPSRGFTLVELLVCVAVLGILSLLATASYRHYLRRAQRTDATVALLGIASAQELHFLQHGEYAGGELLGERPPAGLGITGTERGLYGLTIELPDSGSATGFRALATVISTGSQADDGECWILGIDAQGSRTALTRSGEAGPEVTARCWR